MDLKTSLPKNAPADIVYSLPANFTCKGDKMDGHFCVTKEKIYIFNGSEITLEYRLFRVSYLHKLACAQTVVKKLHKLGVSEKLILRKTAEADSFTAFQCSLSH